MFNINRFLSQCVFYPCSAMHLQPLDLLSYRFNKFVYVDYSVSERELDAHLAHQVIDKTLLEPEDVFGRSWDSLRRRHQNVLSMLHFPCEHPFIAHYRLINGQELLFICWEAVSTFKELFVVRRVAPACLVHIRPGMGFGGNYGSYAVDLDAALHDNPAGLPLHFFYSGIGGNPLCGDYLPTLDRYRTQKEWSYDDGGYLRLAINKSPRVRQRWREADQRERQDCQALPGELPPSFCMSERSLYRQLLRRGFLVDLDGNRLFLTNNAWTRTRRHRQPENDHFRKDEIHFHDISNDAVHPPWVLCESNKRTPADQEVLQNLLDRFGDSRLLERGLNSHRQFELAMRNRRLDDREIRALQRWPIIRSECWNHPEGDVDRFLNQPHAPKVPLYLLEAGIALFVKAMSAVGCWIWYSCEGHPEESLPRCVLGNERHANWARRILLDAEEAGLDGVELDEDNGYWWVISTLRRQGRCADTQEQLQSARRAFTDMGEYVYGHRHRLRELKVKHLRATRGG